MNEMLKVSIEIAYDELKFYMGCRASKCHYENLVKFSLAIMEYNNKEVDDLRKRLVLKTIENIGDKDRFFYRLESALIIGLVGYLGESKPLPSDKKEIFNKIYNYYKNLI